ncbi:hypothetical protein J6590_038803 [Homalodisca vitripennis]|nr:hypothetical protein J6590_038803 [Homalodisca vitripennis]
MATGSPDLPSPIPHRSRYYSRARHFSAIIPAQCIPARPFRTKCTTQPPRRSPTHSLPLICLFVPSLSNPPSSRLSLYGPSPFQFRTSIPLYGGLFRAIALDVLTNLALCRPRWPYIRTKGHGLITAFRSRVNEERVTNRNLVALLVMSLVLESRIKPHMCFSLAGRLLLAL